MNSLRIFSILLAAILLAGCASLLDTSLPTPMPADYVPTAIALTMQAGSTYLPQSTAAMSGVPGNSRAGVNEAGDATSTPLPVPTSTPAPDDPTATPYPITLPPPPTQTPLPEIPPAAIQIYKPGDLSRVTSPLHVSGYYKTTDAHLLRIELRGEDGRLLVRQDKKFITKPLTWSNLSLDLDFEIAATAEVGRLVVSVEDDKGRIMALNSVDLILMSVGDADINPSSAVDEAIVIQQPTVKALIQGGKVVVSGVARPNTKRPLMAELRDDDNKIVGFRQLGVSPAGEDGYGTFAVEVPYKVSALTPARLSVYEDGENVSAMTHLSSLVIMLSP